MQHADDGEVHPDRTRDAQYEEHEEGGGRQAGPGSGVGEQRRKQEATETALVGYSAGNWVAQARGTAPEQRAGQTMRDLNGQNLVVNPVPGSAAALNTAGPVNESNIKLNNPTPAYPGIRYVFNVIDSTHVNYKEAIRYLCQ